MGFPYTDFDAGYDCKEASGALLEVKGRTNLDFPIAGVIGSVAGKFGAGRGPTLALGSISPDYWTRPYLTDPVFDLTGGASFTVYAWVEFLNLTGQHYIFSIHSGSDVNGQAFALIGRETNVSSAAAPQLHLWDGSVLFGGTSGWATEPATTPVMAVGSYQLIGASYDIGLNEGRVFWGRNVGEFYYNSFTGNTSAYDGSASTGSPGFGGVGVAKFTGGGIPASLNYGQLLWWKDRSFTQQDFLNVWNNHAGLDFNQLAGPGDSLAYQYYYRERES